MRGCFSGSLLEPEPEPEPEPELDQGVWLFVGASLLANRPRADVPSFRRSGPSIPTEPTAKHKRRMAWSAAIPINWRGLDSMGIAGSTHPTKALNTGRDRRETARGRGSSCKWRMHKPKSAAKVIADKVRSYETGCFGAAQVREQARSYDKPQVGRYVGRITPQALSASSADKPFRVMRPTQIPRPTPIKKPPHLRVRGHWRRWGKAPGPGAQRTTACTSTFSVVRP